MARAIGVEIGTHTLRLVELSGSAKSFRLQRVLVRDLPPEEMALASTDEDAPPPPTRSEKISALIADLFQRSSLSKDDVGAVLSSRRTTIREITVPFTDLDQIRKVVRFEAENHMHGRSIDDVIVNWIKTGETKDGSRLTVFATPKEELVEHLAILHRAAVDPAAVDLDATALFTGLEACGTFERLPNVVVLDVGEDCSTLILVAEGRPRVFRSFLLGVESLETTVSEELGVGRSESRRRLLAGGAVASDDLLVPAADLEDAQGAETDKSLVQIETDVIAERRGTFVRRLHLEAVRSLMAVRTEIAPDRVLLLGGGSQVAGLPEELSKRFGLPVEVFNFYEHVPNKEDASDVTGATIGPALGAAMRILGRDALGIELRQDEFAPRNLFDVIRVPLATALTLLFLALVGLTYSTKMRRQSAERLFQDRLATARYMFLRAETAYLKGVEAKTPETADQEASRWVRNLPDDSHRIRALQRRLRSRYESLQTELGLSEDIPTYPSAVKALWETYQAFSAVPRENLGTWFRIAKMDVDHRNLRVTVEAQNEETLETAGRLLSENRYFQERAKPGPNMVQPGGVQRWKEDKLRRDYTIEFETED